jgi:hypothetical protein
MNFGASYAYDADFIEGIREIFTECGECCRSGCNDCSSEFNIDQRQARPLVVTCWIVFCLCAVLLVVTIPIVVTKGFLESNKVSLVVFYVIVGFFFVVSCIANFISCRGLRWAQDYSDDLNLLDERD